MIHSSRTTAGERQQRGQRSRTIGIGPVMDGWGSWDWIGAELAAALAKSFGFVPFRGTDVPDCDVAIVVKHALPADVVGELSQRCQIVYAPVDFYGSVADVDADHRMLRRCSRVVVHSERLRKCFAPYAHVQYVDHHVKFVVEPQDDEQRGDELLWVGVRTNVPVLGQWLHRHRLPGPLRVLTNFEDPEHPPGPDELGLPPDLEGVTLEQWTPDVHLRRLRSSRAALDVKGGEFRQWHKPPAKALDFVASGVPLAMNRESSAVEHLRDRYGFEVADPADTGRWFSKAYFEETRDLGRRLRSELSLDRVAERWESVIEDVLEEWSPGRNTTSIPVPPTREDRPRVVVTSLLFEWPTRGGGNVHTYELVQALGRSGFDVRHVFVSYDGWQTGRIEKPLPYDHEVLRFDEGEWSVPNLRRRLKEVVDAFDPDAVVLTDSWNAKPVLAEALSDYPTILRLQALECICPLNNVRLLPGLTQCDGNQLADPERCRRCLLEHRHVGGPLHTAERALCGVGSQAYEDALLRAFRSAEAVLVVNEMTRDLVAPYAEKVIVAPSGFDPERFPWPWPDEPRGDRPLRVVFGGHPEEPIKGYAVLRRAADLLWERRRDFEVVVTGDPPADPLPFERFVGWKSQQELPATLRSGDVCVVPSIAQEALGRVAVEAQAVGRPVVASRIGGLPTTIAEGESGLLFEVGRPDDLARQLERLLDDSELRNRLGEGGRRRFESLFTWETIVERCYRPILRKRERSPA